MSLESTTLSYLSTLAADKKNTWRDFLFLKISGNKYCIVVAVVFVVKLECNACWTMYQATMIRTIWYACTIVHSLTHTHIYCILTNSFSLASFFFWFAPFLNCSIWLRSVYFGLTGWCEQFVSVACFDHIFMFT